MPINPKSTTDAAPVVENVPCTAFAELLHKGVERLAEVEKNTLDMVAKQTTDAFSAWKQVLAMPASMPGMFLLDVAEQAAEKMIHAQKAVIDLSVKQSAAAVETAKRRDVATNWAGAATDVASANADRAVAVQKIWLDFAAEQNKVVAAMIKKQAGLDGSHPAAAAVDTMQRNVDVAIQTQKEIIEAAAKPLKPAAASQAA